MKVTHADVENPTCSFNLLGQKTIISNFLNIQVDTGIKTGIHR